MNSKFRANFDPNFARDRDDALPAIVRIRAERLAAHEGDVAMAKLMQMSQRQLGGMLVVQKNVRDSGNLFVAGDSDHWHGQFVFERGVDRDNSFRAAAH